MSVLGEFLQSDRNAFARMDRAVSVVCRRYMREPADIDDAAQETWLVAWSHGDGLRNSSKAEGWIARIAQRVCLHRCEKTRSEKHAFDKLATDEALVELSTGCGRAETPVLDQEFDDDVQSLLVTLPEKERKVILERSLYPSRKWSEIAEHQGMSEGAVKKVFYRARPRLLRELAALRERYERREEPAIDDRPPAMYVYTLADLAQTFAKLPPDELAQILEVASHSLPKRRVNYDG